MLVIPQTSSETNISQSSTFDGPPRELIFKFILVGNPGAGKTSILKRYIKNKFNEDYQITVGVEFASKYVKIDDDSRVKLQIWDTAGQQSFHNIVKSFFNGSHGVFFIYDVNKRETFEELKKWKDEVTENIDPNAILILMGNQTDIGKREVMYSEGVEWMKKQGMHFFFETSAKSGDNIEFAFTEAARLAFLSYLKARLTGKGNVFMSQSAANINLGSPMLNGKQSEVHRDSCAC